MNFEDIKIFEKSNFWCKIVAQPTPFLGQIEPKYVQVGPILVQFGHVLNLHLLTTENCLDHVKILKMKNEGYPLDVFDTFPYKEK